MSDIIAEVEIELIGVKLMNVEVETLDGTLLYEFKKIDLRVTVLETVRG